MPHATFFSLPEDKRARVVDALKAEFAARPYSRASVDRVTASAGVSKGSFYQYFEDKLDAYTHLVRGLMSERVGLAGAPAPEAPLEEVLTAVVRGSHDFHRRDPLGWAVLARALADDAPRLLDSDESISGGVHRWAVAATAADGSAFDRPEIARVADDVVALLAAALTVPGRDGGRDCGGEGGE